ncbi:hypothetical protein D3C81_1622190 [compost metagenome]
MTTPRLIAAYRRLNTRSLLSFGVMSASNARDVGSNRALHKPLSAFTIKNTQISSASANPINTSAQPNTEMNITVLRPMTSEIYPP